MLTGLFSFLGEAFKLLFFFVQRGEARRNDPLEQHRQRYEEIDRNLDRGDATAAVVAGARDLDELERLRHAGPPAPHGPAA